MRDDGQDRPELDPTEPDPTGPDEARAAQARPDHVGFDPDTPWLHGTWQVTAIDGVDLAGMPAPWLTFDGDGVVFGHAGVNRVRGTWRLDHDELTFGPVVATLMAGPPQATAAERALLGVLDSGGTVSRRADGFTLRGAGRSVDLVRAAAAARA